MSRKKRSTISAVIISLLIGLAVLDNIQSKDQQQNSTALNTTVQSNNDIDKYQGNNFTVIKVVDGDTIDIDIPDGKYQSTRIRLWGVDTPETKKSPKGEMYFGSQASQFTTDLVLEKSVTIHLDKTRDTRGKYGRLLAYIELSDGRILNEVLISEGCAYADLRFKHNFFNKYKQMDSIARKLKKGLWQDVTQEQLPVWLQREKPNLLIK